MPDIGPVVRHTGMLQVTARGSDEASMKGDCHVVLFDERLSTAAVQCTRVPHTNHDPTGHNVTGVDIVSLRHSS